MITVEPNMDMQLVPDLWKFILTSTPSSTLTMRCVNRHFRDTVESIRENPCLLALRDNNPRIIPWLLEVCKIPGNFVIEAARNIPLVYPSGKVEDLKWLLELPKVREWLSSLKMSTNDTRTLIAAGACIGSKISTLGFLIEDGYKLTGSDLIIAFSHGNREVCEYVTIKHETFIGSLTLCENAVEHSNLVSLKYLLESEDLRSHAIRCAIRRSNHRILKFLFEEKKPTSKNVVYALSVGNLELAKLLHTLSEEILTKEHLISCIFPRTFSTFEMTKWLISLGINTRFFVEETWQFVSVELLEWVSGNGYEFGDITKFIEDHIYNLEVMEWLLEKKYVIPGDSTLLFASQQNNRKLFELLFLRGHAVSKEVIEELIKGDKKELFELVSSNYTEDLLRLAITYSSIKIIKLLLKFVARFPEDSFELCLQKGDYYTLGFLYGKGLVITREHISIILNYNIAVKYLEFLANYGYKFSYEDYLHALEKENERAAEFVYSTLTFKERMGGYLTSLF